MSGDFAGQAPRPILPGQYVGNDFVPFSTASPMPVGGSAASDAAVAGNPLLTGGRASTATPTAVSTDGDAVALWANRNGALRIDPVGTTAQPVTDNGGSLTVDGVVTNTPNVFVPTTRTAFQVTATTLSGAVVAADANRRLLVISNIGSVTAYLNPSGTAATSDFPLPAGVSIIMTSLDGDGMAQAQWSCITGSSTAVLGILTAVA